MMSTTRLRGIYRQEQNHRKFVCVMNDVAKTQQDLYEGYIEKEKQEAAQRNQKSIVYTRRNVVRQRVLKKCMKGKRDEVERKHATDIYGRYHGVPVEQIAGEIDTYLEQNHPRIRRRQKIDDLFHEGYEKGAILDRTSIKNKVKEYFDKPLVELHRVSGKKEKNKKNEQRKSFLPPLGNGFYTGNIDHDIRAPHPANCGDDGEHRNSLFVKRKVTKFLTEDIPDDISVSSEVQNKPKRQGETDVRPITLPPIKLGTDNFQPDSKSNPADCIAELITRMSHAKDIREKETKIKKERRAKRFQAEKVHGIGIGHGNIENKNADNGHGSEVHDKNKKHRNTSKGEFAENNRNENEVDKGEIRLPPLKLKSSSLFHKM